MDTTDESEFKRPKSVHNTAKVRSFCAFGLLGWKSVHKTAQVRQFFKHGKGVNKTAEVHHSIHAKMCP